MAMAMRCRWCSTARACEWTRSNGWLMRLPALPTAGTPRYLVPISAIYVQSRKSILRAQTAILTANRKIKGPARVLIECQGSGIMGPSCMIARAKVCCANEEEGDTLGVRSRRTSPPSHTQPHNTTQVPSRGGGGGASDSSFASQHSRSSPPTDEVRSSRPALRQDLFKSTTPPL